MHDTMQNSRKPRSAPTHEIDVRHAQGQAGHAQSGHGRSGPRSRLGCVTCKQRRVRCDETHPVCGHCRRLQLECQYQAPNAGGQRRRRRPQGQEGLTQELNVDSLVVPTVPTNAPTSVPAVPVPTDTDDHVPLRRGRQRQLGLPDSAPDLWAYRSGYVTPNFNTAANNGNGSGLPLTPARRYDFFDVFADLDTSWAGEFSCVLPEVQTPLDMLAVAAAPLGEAVMPVPSVSTDTSPVQMQQTTNTTGPAGDKPTGDSQRTNNSDVAHLMRLFHQIVQPPAAILIGGFERWRRLQHYLCKLGEKSRAVRSALLCLVELLVIDDGQAVETEASPVQKNDRKQRMERILERHATACQEIEAKLGGKGAGSTGKDETSDKDQHLKPKTREHLLAAIFLLSWFEVIRDQDAHTNLFPRHLAERVITSTTGTAGTTSSWSRYSQQLLSWLNTLDSKAAHMGRETLLSPKSLEAVAHFQVHITSSLEDGGVAPAENKTAHDADGDDSELSELSSVGDMSPPGDEEGASSSPMAITSAATQSTPPPPPPLGQVKQILLRTVLQPALEWYLTSQSYCRRISAHDKHHRRRFTSDDEYEVILACKQLEAELFELWDDRPAVMALEADQLRDVVSPDLAKRLEEIFSVYLASFWILFVHLHRISWWHLPHSALARRALAEVWQHMQRAYGEEVPAGPGPRSIHKVIHPSLLWPLFLFGCECTDPSQAQWAIEQLEALGEAKPVLPVSRQPNTTGVSTDTRNDGNDGDNLPPFRLSSGATRNAKRAALLLRQLIKEQNTKQARVDDRDLSMRLFGCYFSII